jgi:hypothetical protein
MSDVALTDQHRIQARDDVLSRNLDGEAVLLDMASGVYFGLDEIGTAIWALIADGTTVRAICQKVVSLYDVDEATVRKDLEALVTELQSRGLVDVTAPTDA